MDGKYETLALHFKYCVLIAVMFLVFLATERWSTSKEFTTYLSNAATMTSLLLGVVAIFYSFISNDGMSRSLGSISTVANEVREVRNDIQNFAAQTKVSTETAANNNTLVQAASVELSGTMASLTETLGAISSQNDTLKELVASLPSRIDQLETKFGDVAKAIVEKPLQLQAPISSTDLPAKAIDRFLARATFQQHLLALACVLAAQNKKPLDIPALCRAIEWNGPNVFQGFLGCMHAVQLCSRVAIEGGDKTYTIQSVHPELQKNAKTSFLKYVDSSFAEKPDDKAKWLGRLGAVEAMLAPDSAGEA
jgi:hypothetical protein